jgi:transcriptional regulator with PAS, ATPase and Fis domain
VKKQGLRKKLNFNEKRLAWPASLSKMRTKGRREMAEKNIAFEHNNGAKYTLKDIISQSKQMEVLKEKVKRTVRSQYPSAKHSEQQIVY